MSETMKLFKVTIKASGKFKEQYVVAEDPTSAYDMVKAFLDDRNLCFSKDRALDSVELIADEEYYSDTEMLLHLPD